MPDALQDGGNVHFVPYLGTPVHIVLTGGKKVTVTDYSGKPVSPRPFTSERIVVTNPQDLPDWVRDALGV